MTVSTRFKEIQDSRIRQRAQEFLVEIGDDITREELVIGFLESGSLIRREDAIFEARRAHCRILADSAIKRYESSRAKATAELKQFGSGNPADSPHWEPYLQHQKTADEAWKEWEEMHKQLSDLYCKRELQP